MPIVIREATVEDAEAIAGLVTALGYPSSPDQLRARLETILRLNEYETLVACDATRVVGFVGTRIGVSYEADGHYGQIMALAVTATHQRRGVGRLLMHTAESRLVGRGIRMIILTSGNHRIDAHAFYEKLGYRFTGRRYKKVMLVGS